MTAHQAAPSSPAIRRRDADEFPLALQLFLLPILEFAVHDAAILAHSASRLRTSFHRALARFSFLIRLFRYRANGKDRGSCRRKLECFACSMQLSELGPKFGGTDPPSTEVLVPTMQ